MLSITRKKNERVYIGPPDLPYGFVEVTLIKGDKVRIAFSFPREVEIHREEVIVDSLPEAAAHLAELLASEGVADAV